MKVYIMKMYNEDVLSQLLFLEEPYAQALSGKTEPGHKYGYG